MSSGKKPSIPQVFQDQSILITGATGFVGKALLEKILRCCPGVGRIYLLVRPKRGDFLKQRMKNLFENAFFDRCRSKRGNINWCCGAAEVAAMGDSMKGPLVVGISGDVAEKGLDLNENDRLHLELHVTIVFHVAASVRFNEPLRQALFLNSRGTREMLELASRMPLLKEFVHVSTAFAHVSNHHTTIEEKFYSVPIEPEDAVKSAEELRGEEFEEITKKLAGVYRNTYLCTKAFAERIIEKDYSHLPVSIYRPGIIMAVHTTPVPGWSEGIQGCGIVVYGCASGLLRTVQCVEKLNPEVVPVDHVVSAMMTIVWAKTVDRSSKTKNSMNKEIPIFNHVSSNHISYSWNKMRLNFNEVLRTDKDKGSLGELKFTSSYLNYELSSFLNLCLIKMLDTVNHLCGKKSNCTRYQKKAKDAVDSVVYFMMNQFKFCDDGLINLRKRYPKEAGTDASGYDSTEFDFDITAVRMKEFSYNYINYMKKDLLKYQDAMLGHSSKNIQKLKVLGCSMGLAGILLSCVSLFYLSTPLQWIYQSIVAVLGNQT